MPSAKAPFAISPTAPPSRPKRLFPCVVATLGWLTLGACSPASTGSGAGTGGRSAGSGGAVATGGNTTPGSGGNGSGGAASGGNGSGGAASGGSGSGGAATGGSRNTGGAGGGSSPDGGVDGSADVAGGAGTSGTGGRGGSGAGGAGGARDGGADSGSNGGAGASPAAALDGFRIECPCKPAAADHTSDGNCNVTPATDRQTIMKTMGGDPGTIYNVTLRVRGLTEPNTYRNGTLQGQRFYIGGTTSAAGYTSYMMTVADPAQHYFFNYNASVGHVHFLLDYQVTVKIRGGSKVTFDVNGDGSVPDGHGVSNFDKLVVPDVPPAPNWYDGQFVQLDVISAQPAP